MATLLKSNDDVRAQISDEEWALRVDLAAAYRLAAHYGWDDLIFTHMSVRVPGPEGTPPRPVEIGLRDREKVQIVAGLSAGDSVLLPQSASAGPAAAGGGPRPSMGMFGGPRR